MALVLTMLFQFCFIILIISDPRGMINEIGTIKVIGVIIYKDKEDNS